MAKIEGITNKFPIIPSIYFNMDNLHQRLLPVPEHIPVLVVRIPAVAEDSPELAAVGNSAALPEYSPVVAVEVYIPAAADTAAVAAVLPPAS